MRDLDGLHDASEFDLLVAPIELADLDPAQNSEEQRLASRLGRIWPSCNLARTAKGMPGKRR